MFIECKVPESEHLALWSPPPNTFTEHEASAILRHTPVVDVYKRISVQGFEFVGYNPSRKYDSSAVWASSGGNVFLCRVLRFFEVASCCHPECEVELVAEVLRYQTKKVSPPKPCEFEAEMKADQKIEYVSTSSFLAKVVVLFPHVTEAPKSMVQRRKARATMVYGPFLVFDVSRKQFQ